MEHYLRGLFDQHCDIGGVKRTNVLEKYLPLDKVASTVDPGQAKWSCSF